MKRRLRHTTLMILGAAAMPAFSQPTGQDPVVADQPEPIATLKQVTVTANKRVESVQNTATTVRALSAEDLDSRGWSDFAKYAQFIPGLDFQKGGASQTQVIIRGATVGRVTPAEPQSRSLVGLYLNDIPLDLNGLNPDIDLFDTRVEVLKGPQGSLYGDSAMSGAIRYITSPADTAYAYSRWAAGLASIHGGGNSYDLKGMVNFPLKQDVAGLRLVVVRRDSDGWSDNRYLGDRDTNTFRSDMWRGAFRLEPTERAAVDVFFMQQKVDAGSPPFDTDAPGTDGLGGRIEYSRQSNEWIRDDIELGSVVVDYDFAGGTLSSITAYQSRVVNRVAVELAESLAQRYFGSMEGGTLRHDWDTRRFSQELRFVSDLDGRFNFTGGAFYSDQRVAYDNIGHQAGLDEFVLDTNLWEMAPDPEAYAALGCGDSVDVWFCGPEINEIEQVALFGEVYFDVTDALRLAIGGRYYDYRQYFLQDFGGIVNYGRFIKEMDSEATGFNPKFTATYRLSDDSMLYTNIAKGYRLGGVGNALPPFCDADIEALGLSREDLDTFAPDSLWSYEFGSKNTLRDRATLNASVYFTRWTDVQTPVNLACGYIPTGNAGEVRSHGIEIETAASLTQDLLFNAALSWNDTSLVGAAPALGGEDGDRAPFVPRFKGSAGLDWSRDIGRGMRVLSLLDLRYTSKAYDTYTMTNIIPAQFVANVRTGINFADRYRVMLYVDNVTNEDVVTNVRTRFGLITRYTGQPRTVGLEFSADF